jgi:membrane protein DedA with SNARE-associated domain
MLEHLLDWLQSHPPGPAIYPVLAAIAFVETLFPPFPGDVLFVAAGSWAGSSPAALPGVALPSFLEGPALNLVASAASGFAGCLAATVILLYAGRGMARSRTGGALARWVGRERIDRAERLFRKRGGVVLLGSRFIPGIRSVLVLVAGSSRMKISHALTWAGGSAVLWYSGLAVLGNVIGRNLVTAREFFRHYEGFVLAAVGAGAAILLLARAARRRKQV